MFCGSSVSCGSKLCSWIMFAVHVKEEWGILCFINLQPDYFFWHSCSSSIGNIKQLLCIYHLFFLVYVWVCDISLLLTYCWVWKFLFHLILPWTEFILYFSTFSLASFVVVKGNLRERKVAGLLYGLICWRIWILLLQAAPALTSAEELSPFRRHSAQVSVAVTILSFGLLSQ